MREDAAILAKLATPDKGLQAEPSEGWGARTIPRTTNLDALTPASIKTMLQNAESGDLSAQAELFELMEERDGEMAAHLRTRRAAVTRCEWGIEPADETPQAKKAAELCAKLVDGMPNIAEGVFDLLDAIGKGFAILEIEWQTGRKQWTPLRLLYRPQRWFTLADDGVTFELLGDTPGETVAINPSNFIIHKVRSQSGFEWRTSLLRSCVRAFIVRLFSWKDWMAFAEVYGSPMRIGKLRSGAAWNSTEAQQLYAAVRAIGQDYAAVIEGENEIEILEGKVGHEGQIFDTLIEKAGRELTLAILGQTLTSGGESGGSYALGQVHNQVRWDLIESDAKALERTMRAQFLRPLTFFNLGPQYPVPLWNIIVEKPENLAELATTMKTVWETGLPIPSRWAYERFGIPKPQKGEPVLPGPQAGGALFHDKRRLTPRRQAVNAVSNQADLDAETTQVIPKDGLAWLRQKRVVDDALWKELGPSGKQLAWHVEGLGVARTADVARELIAVFEAGHAIGEFLQRLEDLGLAVVGDAEPGAGQIHASHARLVHAQNQSAAWGADRWIKAMAALAERPYGQYRTVGDDDVRPAHRRLDGTIKPLSDPFWNSYMPPWEFGCRCQMVTLSQAEMDGEGLSVTEDAEMAGEVRPNPDWAFNRSDAYFRADHGQEPVTEAGRAEWARIQEQGVEV